MPSDSFNRPDSDSLGFPWIQQELDFFGNPITGTIAVRDQQLRLRSNTGVLGTRGFAYYNAPFSPNQRSELEFRSIFSPLANPLCGPAVRILPTSTVLAFTGYVIRYTPGSVRIMRYVAEPISLFTGTTLAVLGFTLIPGERLALEVIGTTLRMLMNDTLLTSVNDSTITSGLPGFVAVNTAAAGDESSARWDNWVGNSNVSGSGLRKRR